MPMPVNMEATEIEGVLLVKTGLIRDNRGYFSESYSRMMWEDAGFTETFVQDNLSQSARGTLRGMHYQIEPEGMGKLVRCVKGAIFDVAVDLRRSSPSFGQWVGRGLTGENGHALWVPAGFAHGFLALDDDTLVYYKCTAHHAPDFERSLSYKCPKVGITWPLTPTLVSPKDEIAPGLDEAEYNFE